MAQRPMRVLILHSHRRRRRRQPLRIKFRLFHPKEAYVASFFLSFYFLKAQRDIFALVRESQTPPPSSSLLCP